MMKNSYEILSPAGNFDALVAGINSGCNAIYLGGEKFSARSKAINFSNEELIKAVEYAHLRNVKIYVTINILIDDKEMKEALSFTKFLYSIGVDGIIVQDLGFASIARRLFKDMEVHASTQMAINNYYGAKFVESLGFERVVLARETDLDEINKIKEHTSLDIEAFIHGALCVAFSGECLMSSMIGGRSGNRGDCAQPCRKKYSIYDLNKEKIADEAYFLSTKDLNTLNDVEDLIQRGVYSLKIEGRMKRPEYVAQIVSSYKKSLEHRLNEEDYQNTAQIFNRGFTRGLFNDDFGREFISYDRPDNRGILAGEVIGGSKGSYILKFTKDINEKDGLEFESLNGHFGVKADFFAKAGANIKFKTNKKIKINSKIYKTSSEKLLIDLNEKINSEFKFQKINIFGDFILGNHPKIKVQYKDMIFEAEDESIIEKAQKNPLSEDKIKEKLIKLGGTVYEAEKVEINVKGDIFIPISVLNNLRRTAIDKLDDYIAKVSRENIEIPKDIYSFQKYSDTDNQISVEVYDLESLKKLDFSKISNIYIDIRNIDIAVIDYIRKNKLKISVVFPKFQNSKELERSVEKLDNLINNVEYVVLNNLAQVEIFKDKDIKKIADIGLNVFNSYTAREFLNMGFDKVILSPELNWKQIKNIVKNIGSRAEILSHGLIPVMTMPHCPMSIVKNCKNADNCSKCRFSKGFYIKDMMNVNFLVERRDRVSEIFNSYPIMLLHKVEDMKNMGVSNFKLNIREEFDETISLYDKALNGKNYSDDLLREKLIEKYENITYGHYNRGIINE